MSPETPHQLTDCIYGGFTTRYYFSAWFPLAMFSDFIVCFFMLFPIGRYKFASIINVGLILSACIVRPNGVYSSLQNYYALTKRKVKHLHVHIRGAVIVIVNSLSVIKSMCVFKIP